MQVVFVSDYFIEDIGGSPGAESVDGEIRNILKNKYNVSKIRSCDLNADKIKSENTFYLISNFTQLSPSAKQRLYNCRYVIIEHDHKYINTRNPSRFENYIAPFEKVINYDFYKNAEKVLCQSKLHSDVINRNIFLTNVENMGCSLWSKENLEYIKAGLNNQKIYKYGIIKSDNEIKGTNQASKYCEYKKITPHIINPSSFENFIKELSLTENIVFIPQTLETFCRVLVEAKMLNCNVITNSLNGCTSEEWFSELSGLNLIEYVESQRNNWTETLYNTIDGVTKEKEYVKDLVSIVIPTYNDAEYLSKCLDDLLYQTYQKIEIVVVDDGSTDNTIDLLHKYSNLDDRIKFYSKKNGGTGSALNYGFSRIRGEYSTWSSSDDRKTPDYISDLINNLKKYKADYIISSYHSDRFNRTWRAYVPDEKNSFVSTQGFDHDNVCSGKCFTVSDWPEINYYRCHSGVSFLFKSSLKDRSGYYLEMPGEDYHMAVRMGILSSKTLYLDKVLGTHCYPPDSITSTNPLSVLPAEQVTRRLIKNWKTS